MTRDLSTAAPWDSASIAIAVVENDPILHERAYALGKELGVQIIDREAQPGPFRFVLRQSKKGLSLQPVGDDVSGPVAVDFVQGATAFRSTSARDRRQPIARALGLSSESISIIDATAGLARDAFLLATLGSTVTLIERNPILFCLIRDAMNRAEHGTALSKQFVARMNLILADANEFLSALDDEERPDAIYLDPMYEPRSKSSLAKKEMRILRQLLGNDEDADKLLTTARGIAKRRVAVKRNRQAPLLAPNPDFQVESKQVRFDVYIRK